MLPVSQALFYAAIPVAAAFMTAVTVVRLVRLARGSGS
jgi:TRAP-type C4-dicarboxylate transport system permease small subunit